MKWQVDKRKNKTGTHWITFQSDCGFLYFTWEGLNNWAIAEEKIPLEELIDDISMLTECAISYFDNAGGFGIGGISEEIIGDKIKQVNKWLGNEEAKTNPQQS